METMILKTDKEYAASHSVDTSWFAVDKNGNLGYMEATENGVLPVHLSADDIREEKNRFACLIEMSELIEPNCYYLPLTEKSVEDAKKDFQELAFADVNARYLCWQDDCGQTFITNGCSFRELNIWKNRKPESVFFFIDKEETFFTVYNIDKNEDVKEDFRTGRICGTDAYDLDWKLGYHYEGWGLDGPYSKPEEQYVELYLKPLKKENFRHIVPINKSFEADKEICLLDEMFVHYPCYNCDDLTVEDLRKKFDVMTHKERVEYMFNSTLLSDGNLDDVDWTGRIIGVLLAEYDVSPHDKNKNGETAIECARRKFKEYKSSDDKRYDGFMYPVLKMFELKERELCNK